MQKVSASVEEAARVSGASPWKTMKEYHPAAAWTVHYRRNAAGIYVPVADFGVSAVLGAPNQIRLMTTEIFSIINRPDMADHLQIAAAYSMLCRYLHCWGYGPTTVSYGPTNTRW